MSGESLNILQQMDVDEFYGSLMDKLESLLKPSHNEFLVKSVFEGTLSNELIGRGEGCTHCSERSEHFISLSLTVLKKKSIIEGLQSFVKGEMLDGENSYFCEKCDKKVPTLKRQSIKTLPNQLVLALKRFDFDLETMQKLKINSYCEFPDTIDLKPFSADYLKSQEGSTPATTTSFPDAYY